LTDDALPGWICHNRSVMNPYGVWAVITPFNFPFALMGVPVADALTACITVVAKAAPDTPWSGRLLADCFRDAGLPAGVFNLLCDPEDEAGPLLVEHPDVAGVTFTGSHEVGMEVCHKLNQPPWPRPCIAEMGGKNACIVTRHGDLDRAALGIARSAFGLSGQKCSALSRIYVEDAVADALIEKLRVTISKLSVGDPTLAAHWMGPVATESSYEKFQAFCEQLHHGAEVLAGGRVLGGEGMNRGYFCAPTLAEAPLDHPLWQQEMFTPIAMLARVADKETAMRLANDTPLGLTAGFYGNPIETDWFFNHIEAGVTYANRPQGATTGAWPGYQPFGGWKGSGSTGKGIASFYYLQQYLREQSQTRVE
jgi:1-pyrroline-5-carboxylate dehydrogenase